MALLYISGRGSTNRNIVSHSGVSLTGLRQIQSIFNIGLDFTLIITVKKELKICSMTQLS